MNATPGYELLIGWPALPVLPPPAPSERSDPKRRWGARAALVALAFGLGLLQGSRAALGDMPLADDGSDEAVALDALPPADEPDAVRGRFFRPVGSSATRPALRLRPEHWSPRPDEPPAGRCGAAGC